MEDSPGILVEDLAFCWKVCWDLWWLWAGIAWGLLCFCPSPLYIHIDVGGTGMRVWVIGGQWVRLVFCVWVIAISS